MSLGNVWQSFQNIKQIIKSYEYNVFVPSRGLWGPHYVKLPLGMKGYFDIYILECVVLCVVEAEVEACRSGVGCRVSGVGKLYTTTRNNDTE